MAYIKPQVLVYQEFTTSPASNENELRAWIVGPNAVLHRYSEPAEKDEISAGSLPSLLGKEVAYPNREYPGNAVDPSYVRVFADNAKLEYAYFASGAVNVYNSSNLITMVDDINLATNGSELRSSQFERDVRVGDFIRLTAFASSGTPGEDPCEDTIFESEIISLVPTMLKSLVAEPEIRLNTVLYGTEDPTITAAASDAGTVTAGTLTRGNVYKVNFGSTVEGGGINYTVVSGLTGESVEGATTSSSDRTIELNELGTSVTLSSTPAEGSSATFAINAKYGTDYVSPTVTPSVAATTNPVSLGVTGNYNVYETGRASTTYKVTITQIIKNVNCESVFVTVTGNGTIISDIQVPFKSTGTESEAFYLNDEETLSGTFTGSLDNMTVGDYYTVNLSGSYKPVVVGASGNFTGSEDVTYFVQCLKGGVLGSASAPIVVVTSSDGAEYYKGTLSASTVDDIITSEITLPRGITISFYGSGDFAQLALDDFYSIRVSSPMNGAIQTIQIKDSLPFVFREWSSSEITNPLNISFFIKEDVELGADDFEAGIETITFSDSINLNNFEFTDLKLLDADVYVNYREWVAEGAGELNFVASADDLEKVPGQLDPDNPLKYAVYKALANSNGTAVVYTPVDSDYPETDLDAWNTAFATGSGTTEVYSIVPLTQRIDVQNLAVAAVEADSNEEVCAWKHTLLNTAVPNEETAADVRGVIIADAETGKYDTVVISDEYKLDTDKIKAGDLVRVIYRGELTDFAISEVVSTTELKLKNTPNEQIGTGSEEDNNFTYVAMTIVHILSKNDKVEYLTNVAGSFSNRRVELVWPDVVYEGTREMPGYMLCAAIGGMMSGIQPHQGLTRTEISGFDGYYRSYPFFNATQLKQLAAGGVWIVLTDREGTAYVYHAVTTDMLDANSREEMITRNMDSISMYLGELLRPYIGTSNVTSMLITEIYDVLDKACRSLKVSTYSNIGGRLLDYDIKSIEQDALLKDRINVIVDVDLPMAANNIALYIYA